MKSKPSVKVVFRGDKGKYVLRWKDASTHAAREKTTDARTRREADRLAGELQAALQEGRYREPTRVLWDDFRQAFEDERAAGFKESSQMSYASSLNHVERIAKPNRLVDLDAAALSHLQTRLRNEGLSESTIARHLRHVKAALNWGVKVGIVSEAPNIVMPRRVRRSRAMRGRPLQEAEKNQLVTACKEVRSEDYADWQELIEGLWLSGLRLREALILGWDESAMLSIDTRGKYPAFRIRAEGEKGFRDRLLPLVPDFAVFVERLSSTRKTGRVFRLGKRRLSPVTVGRVLSKVGREAKVVVNEEQGKYASAHDLRRSFATRWAAEVKPFVLKELMRHESIETTLKHYVSLECDDVAKILWQDSKEVQS